jgi:hypothetical protein
MAGTTNFPTSADDFSTTSPTNLGDADSKSRTHSQRHDDMEAAMEAVQAWALTGAAWTSYTPTLGGFTAGNGTWSAAYARLGTTCFFRATFTFGTTSAAATAFPTVSLPVTAAAATNVAMHGHFFDSSASAYYTAGARQSSTTVVSLAILSPAGVIGPSGLHVTCTATAPFTWATDDQIVVSGTYETA